MSVETLSEKTLLAYASRVNGLLRVSGESLLSLPVFVDADSQPARLRIHFNHNRESHIRALVSARRAELFFMQGPWFIDPSWVPRQPHAPTEIKLSFSVQGTVRPLTRAPSSILNDFGLITRNRQAQFASSSNWEVSDMTAEYRDGLLARLVEFEISVESIAPVQVMAMQHLNVDEREQLISVLDQQPGYAGAVALLEALHRA